MKSTGIVRKVDELGRIVLPIELRRTLDIAEKDSLEIYMDGPAIVLKKYQRLYLLRRRQGRDRLPREKYLPQVHQGPSGGAGRRVSRRTGLQRLHTN